MKRMSNPKKMILINEEPRSGAARNLIVRSYYFHIRSLTPQQAARNALAIRFIELLMHKLIRPHGSHSGPDPESSDFKRQRHWIPVGVYPVLDTGPV